MEGENLRHTGSTFVNVTMYPKHNYNMLIKKEQKTSVVRDVEKLKPLYTIGGNVTCAATMENNVKVSKIK
jgi:hypothetical protein